MIIASKNRLSNKTLLIAAIAGGLAEVIWILFYARFSDVSTVPVVTEITKTFFPGIAIGPISILTGILIHFILSIILLFLIVKPVVSRLPKNYMALPRLVVLSVTLLTLVWVINFFIILPYVNPVFVTVLPYSVTLVSKFMFGLAAGLTLGFLSIQNVITKRDVVHG